MELTPEEGRVLGCLVEKQLTTPAHYPLTDNALIAACNQATSRDPVVQYDLTTVRVAVRSLREQGLVRTVHRSGERSDKHQHELPTALDLSPAQVAVLAVLLLRGPQTPAELRARTERMHAFASPGEVEDVLRSLADRDPPLVTRLERRPGRREDRYAETLVGVPATAGPTVAAQAPSDVQTAVPLDDVVVDDAPRPTLESLAAELAGLRSDVDALRAELADLRGRASSPAP
ncbi:MAG: YceH family protein [Actinomycetes bacterium]